MFYYTNPEGKWRFLTSKRQNNVFYVDNVACSLAIYTYSLSNIFREKTFENDCWLNEDVYWSKIQHTLDVVYGFVIMFLLTNRNRYNE